MTIDPNLAQKSVAQYFEATRSKDAQKWANRFTENAVVEDPVGTKPLNGSAEVLEMGKTFLSGFETVGLHEEFVHVVGNEAAARWTGKGVTKEGQRVRFEGINIFEFNDEGKIVNLKCKFKRLLESRRNNRREINCKVYSHEQNDGQLVDYFQ